MHKEDDNSIKNKNSSFDREIEMQDQYQLCNQQPTEKNANISSESIIKIEDSNNERKLPLQKVAFVAEFCIQNNRYEDAVRYVDEMVTLKQSELTSNERDLFISAYKLFIGEKRVAWHVLHKQEAKDETSKLMMMEIKTTYEENILKACNKLITLINNHLMNKTKTDEGITLLLKVKADHYRYMAEITFSQTLLNNKQNAHQLYKQAYEKSSNLENLNATKLSVALNYAVFMDEILDKRMNAIFLCKEALNKVMMELKNYTEQELSDIRLKESLEIVELMNENIHIWYKEEFDLLNVAKQEQENSPREGDN